MLLRLSTVLVVALCLVQSSLQQQMRQRQDTTASVAAEQQSPLLQQLAAPTTNLQKRHAKNDNTAMATGFTGGHHHSGHHLGAGGGGGAVGGLGHGHGGHGKFFMYAHQPEHKHYEFGFKRGNDKHVVERYEKGGPHHNFKSKFRWHDAHGGHGERYWDYNHGDHHGGDGGSGGGDDGHHGYHSEPVPEFIQPGLSNAKDAYRHRRKSSENKKSNYQKKPTGLEKKSFVGPKEQQLFKNSLIGSGSQNQADSSTSSDANINDMLGFDPFSPPEIMKSHSQIGGISSVDAPTPSYQFRPTTLPSPISKPYFSRNSKPKNKPPKKYKSADNIKISSQGVPKLAFDLDSGRVYDERTGKWFRLVAD